MARHAGADPAPPGASLRELREAIKAVIGSVDKLRDETLPDICRKLRSIESSTHAAHGAASRAAEHTDVAEPSPPTIQRRPSRNKMAPQGWPSALSDGDKHASGQTSELRDVVRSLHEQLEERMWAAYQQQSAQWEGRLQALLREARKECAPVVPSSSSLRSRASSMSGGDSPFIGQWRDLQGDFCSGMPIVIAEGGWRPLEPGMSELDPAAANPIEFLSGTRCKLLLPADEASSQGGPFDVELSLDGSLTVTPLEDAQGGASFTLTRVAGRRRSKRLATPDGQGGLRLFTPGERPSRMRSLASKLAPSVGVESARSESSARLHLRLRKQRRLGFFLTRRYELVQVAMIVLDAVVLAWRMQRGAELLARHPYESAENGIKDDVRLVFLNDLFCLWYTVDLVGRGLAGSRYFFRRAVCLPHSFDVFIGVAYIMEVVAVHAHYDEGSKSSFRFWVGLVSFVRTLRLLRLVHMSKLVRIHRAFRELRMMMYALQGAMKSLVWSLVVLLVILLISGMVFTNGYLRHIVYNQKVPDGQELLDLEGAFGTLFVSMFTLTLAVTGGKDWGEVYLLLKPMSWPYRVFYVVFQMFATLALLNVITAVFVESTMQRSTRDRESAAIDEICARKELLTKMNVLFAELDEDNDGQIGREELRERMQNGHVAAYFSSLGLDVDRVDKLFLLLDRDSSGTIDRQEFLRGCFRLKGDAKSVDLAVLQSDVDIIIQDMEEMSELMALVVEKMDFLFESRATFISSI